MNRAVVIVAGLVLAIGAAWAEGQTNSARLKVSDVQQLEAALAALTTRVTAAEAQLTAANLKITALEKRDTLVINKFLGTKAADGTWPSAEISFYDTDGSASVSTTIPQGTSAP